MPFAQLSSRRLLWTKPLNVWHLAGVLLLAACGGEDPGYIGPEGQGTEPSTSVAPAGTDSNPATGFPSPDSSGSPVTPVTPVAPVNSTPSSTVNPGPALPTSGGVDVQPTPTTDPTVPPPNLEPGPGSVEPEPNQPAPGTDVSPNVEPGTGGVTPNPDAVDPQPTVPEPQPDPSNPEPKPGGIGFHVSDGKLLDVNGNEFIMRGVNDPYAWYKDGAQQRMADIASVGANAVRVVLASGDQWTRVSGDELSNIIAWTKTNKLVAILEVHDATGFNDKDNYGSSYSPDVALEYWKSSDVRSAIDGQEAYIIINIANEPFGNEASNASMWESWHASAVSDLRAAGLKHTLMVDAANWGQDWESIMLNNAPNVFNADPDKNTIFSVHMYEVYDSADKAWSYMETFLGHGLPLVVGEFAANHKGAEVAEDAIMEAAVEYGVGYLGWSWSGNSTTDQLQDLDITNMFDVGSLTAWGERLVRGANGIEETAQVCTCFN